MIVSDFLHPLNQVDVYAELMFWLGFFFFNFSLFAFNYFINIREAAFLPIKKTIVQGGFFVSSNADFFRFSIDISLLILLIRFSSTLNGVLVISGYYCFLLIFNTYHYSFNKIYQVNPILLNDLKLIKNGAGILWDESKIKFVSGVSLLIFAAIVLTVSLKNYLIFASSLPPNLVTTIATILFILVFSTALMRKGYKHKEEVFYRFLIHFLRLGRHGVESYKLTNKRRKLNLDTLKKHRKLKIEFREEPNVYLLFIESYGSILLKQPYLSKIFTEKVYQFKQGLKGYGWGCKTNFSSSVSLIGPSWMAYSSLLLGTRIDTNFYYEFLLNEKRIYEYDSLMKIFKNHGYLCFNLNATKFKKGVNVPLDQIKNFYGIDKFILRQDIEYNGTKYGFTENPPDQYVINYAYDEYLRNLSKPFVLFYLTKNSHTPFYSPVFVRNWKELRNTPDQLVGHNFLQKPDLKDYILAIDYQLEFLADFIVQKGKGNDVFLVIGDHQPHGLCNQSDGPETIVHVISKDADFLSEFDQYGFRDTIEKLNNPVKHEAMYSIFLRSFVKTYGKVDQEIPDYEPNGIEF